ncbi:hypothetical protein [Achromobacter sp. DH1f]|uniref:DUF7946 domain-containing protein n=1 Tax=Achromobacter sp. DH1f TaxID=1397275 RepID=UPI0012FE9EE8|nr:hypothetical protein [Achromobacter sp. DH1f]
MSDTDVVFRYDGMSADQGELSLYDSAEALKGVATLINQVSHAFANDNEVRDRIANPQEVVTTMVGAKRGCFEYIVNVRFSDRVVGRIGKSVVLKHFWDYLDLSVLLATGSEAESNNPHIRKIASSDDTPFEELAIRLEQPLKNILRPIYTSGAEILTLNRPYAGDRLFLDSSSYDYVSTSETDDALGHWNGNVTKYNILTGYGRVYLDSIRRTIPFNIVDFPANQRAHQAATASMNDRAQGVAEGKRGFVGHKVSNAVGRIKRILVTEINQPYDS